MPNSFETSKETLEQQLIGLLDSRGIEDPDVKELLQKVVDSYHADAEQEVSQNQEIPDVSHRTNIKAEIKIAMIYAKTERYKEEGIDSLYDALGAASQNEATEDLVEEIRGLIKELE